MPDRTPPPPPQRPAAPRPAAGPAPASARRLLTPPRRTNSSFLVGIYISAALLIPVAVVLYFTFLKPAPADEPTDATAPEKLVRQELPAKAAAWAAPKNPDADATAAYAKVFEYYQENVAGPLSPNNKERFTTPEAAELVALAATAGNAGRYTYGAWDERIPRLPHARDETVDVVQNVAEIVGLHALDLYRNEKKAEAAVATKALWSLGMRAFAENTRFSIRAVGLEILSMAVDLFHEFDKDVAVKEWLGPIGQAKSAWLEKGEVVFAASPGVNVADVIRVAEQDKDPTWRVEALYKLGSLKWDPGAEEHRIGNKRIILEAIARAKAAKDPLTAKAGAAAEALTLEQHKQQS